MRGNVVYVRRLWFPYILHHTRIFVLYFSFHFSLVFLTGSRDTNYAKCTAGFVLGDWIFTSRGYFPVFHGEIYH